MGWLFRLIAKVTLLGKLVEKLGPKVPIIFIFISLIFAAFYIPHEYENFLEFKQKYPGNNPIKSLFKDISQTKHLDKALDMIQNSNIIPECQVTAHKYYERAIQSLNTVPPSIYRTSLEELAAYMIDRKY